MALESNRYQGEYRLLSVDQIAQLTCQGCSCDDWSKVQVAEGFNAETVKLTHFSGHVRLGVFEEQISFFGGVVKPAGISNATIHNCTIGNNVYISKVRNYVANYIIEDSVRLSSRHRTTKKQCNSNNCSLKREYSGMCQ